MKGFEPVTLAWQGDRFTVPAEKQLRLIAEIEDALTVGSNLPAINVLLSGTPKHSRLAGAYGAALRYAGAVVTDEEIYISIMEGFAKGGAEAAIQVQDAVIGLLSIISPPAARALRAPDDGEDPAKKDSPAPVPD